MSSPDRPRHGSEHDLHGAFVAEERNALRNRIRFLCCLASAARMGMLLTGCGLCITASARARRSFANPRPAAGAGLGSKPNDA